MGEFWRKLDYCGDEAVPSSFFFFRAALTGVCVVVVQGVETTRVIGVPPLERKDTLFALHQRWVCVRVVRVVCVC